MSFSNVVESSTTKRPNRNGTTIVDASRTLVTLFHRAQSITSRPPVYIKSMQRQRPSDCCDDRDRGVTSESESVLLRIQEASRCIGFWSRDDSLPKMQVPDPTSGKSSVIRDRSKQSKWRKHVVFPADGSLSAATEKHGCVVMVEVAVVAITKEINQSRDDFRRG